MNSLKKQILWGVLGTAIATIIFGIILSLLVNYGLKQLEDQPNLVPDGTAPPSNPAPL